MVSHGMSTGRLFHFVIVFIAGVVALDGYLYAVGGYDSSSQLRTVERYCMVTDKWEFVAPMKSPRSALSVAVLGGKLYALGEEGITLFFFFFFLSLNVLITSTADGSLIFFFFFLLFFRENKS